MQLRTARLCLDCEEIHDAQQCPLCASETFAYISRWVPAPERRDPMRPRPGRPEPETRRSDELTAAAPSRGGTLLKRGVMGLTALGLLGGWFLRNRAEAPPKPQPSPPKPQPAAPPPSRPRQPRRAARGTDHEPDTP